jgi:predicted dehydrogenase
MRHKALKGLGIRPTSLMADRPRCEPVHRVAVIGLGKMGLLHASLLSVIPGVKLVALCEKSRLIRRLARKIFRDVQIVAHPVELADMGLDGVYVATPPSSHAAVIKAVLSARVAHSIFVEKPLASSAKEAEELCRLVEQQGVRTNMVGYNRRFSATFRRAKEFLDEGELGEVDCFQAYAYSSDFVGAKSDSRSRSLGGVLRDLGVHAVDLALWFFGAMKVVALETGGAKSRRSWDSIHFKVRTASGPEGEITTSWCMQNYRLPEVGLIIKGSKGILEANDDTLELKHMDGKRRLWHRHDLDSGVFFLLGGPDYLRENEAFVRAMAHRAEVEPDFRAAAVVDQIIDSVEQRLREHAR